MKPGAPGLRSLQITGDPGLTSTDADVQTAQRQRQAITQNAGIAALAGEAEASVQPRDALEAMLTDQLAAAHNAALKILGQASIAPSAESMFRLVAASVRLMTAYQEGYLALYRVRGGGQQTVVVQHVNVTGQAVVAGSLLKRGGQHAGE